MDELLAALDDLIRAKATCIEVDKRKGYIPSLSQELLDEAKDGFRKALDRYVEQKIEQALLEERERNNPWD